MGTNGIHTVNGNIRLGCWLRRTCPENQQPGIQVIYCGFVWEIVFVFRLTILSSLYKVDSASKYVGVGRDD